MGIFKRNEKLTVTQVYDEKDKGRYRVQSDESSDDFLHATGTIDEDGDVIDNVTGGVIASHDDDKHSRHLPFELYQHYAEIQRSYEDQNDFNGLRQEHTRQLKDPHSNLSPEKIESQLTLRRAKKYAVFFLITTDILGPSNAPFAISRLGYVPGIILYITFGCLAIIGGFLLNRAFLMLDSNNYPVRTFADLASRIFGHWSRYFIGALQFIQLVMNVGVICLGSGQSLALSINSTKDDPKLCFVIQVLVWALLGMAIGQIRSLKTFSHIANSAVWMNVAICVITVIGAALGGPNIPVAMSGLHVPYTGPPRTQAVVRPGYLDYQGLLGSRITALNQMVFAWGGATIFCEIMAEMSRPRQFTVGMSAAEFFIMVIYLVFGILVYHYQGQYTYIVANQGIKQYSLQLATNIISLVSGVLAAVMYGNVGLKVLYQGFGVPDLKFPPLTTKRGALLWAVLVIVYWGVAFVIGLAIPQISDLSSLIGAVCILNFSYTLPAAFALTILVRQDAASLDQYDPVAATVERHDSWHDWARWKRGVSRGGWKRQIAKVALSVMFFGGLTLSGLGMYGAITQMISDYKQIPPVFSCAPPVQN